MCMLKKPSFEEKTRFQEKQECKKASTGEVLRLGLFLCCFMGQFYEFAHDSDFWG